MTSSNHDDGIIYVAIDESSSVRIGFVPFPFPGINIKTEWVDIAGEIVAMGFTPVLMRSGKHSEFISMSKV